MHLHTTQIKKNGISQIKIKQKTRLVKTREVRFCLKVEKLWQRTGVLSINFLIFFLNMNWVQTGLKKFSWKL
jgi:hypothetical protein